MSNDKKVLVIVCTYNEKDNIGNLVFKILEHAPDVNVLIIDDNSPDGTGLIADNLAAGDNRVTALHREGKLGLGTAQVFGLNWAARNGYDAAVTMDADFSHDPIVIPEMIKAGDEHDYIIGSRYIPGGKTVNWGLHRKLLSRGGNIFAKTLLRIPANDLTTGFRYLNLHRLQDIRLDLVRAHGYGFFIESTFRVIAAGIVPFEVPIVFMDRQFGQSKMSMSIATEELGLVFRLWREKRNKRSFEKPEQTI